jgi:hypothetical protein
MRSAKVGYPSTWRSRTQERFVVALRDADRLKKRRGPSVTAEEAKEGRPPLKLKSTVKKTRPAGRPAGLFCAS